MKHKRDAGACEGEAGASTYIFCVIRGKENQEEKSLVIYCVKFCRSDTKINPVICRHFYLNEP
jgi:hypothetical protein